MTRVSCLIVAFVILIAPIAVLSAAQESETVFFKGVRVFDGVKSIGVTNVLIEDGKIAAVGGVDPKPDSKVIDGRGKTLLPGMIDCHTHVWFETHLQQAAMFGVTTELDMMSSPGSMKMFRSRQKRGKANNRADVFSAGAAVTVKGGHGTQFGMPVPTLKDAAGAAQFVRQRVREGSDYIKLIHEDGSAYGMTLPTLTEKMFSAAVESAHESDKLAVAHISTAEGASLAIRNDINGLVHLFANEKIDATLIEDVKSKKIFVVPTAAVVSNTAGANTTAGIIKDKSLRSMMTNENLSNLAKGFSSGDGNTNSWDNLRHNIAALHKAGVPILAGTDAPNPGTVHGASMHHELRLLVDVGLSPVEALAAATSKPAEQFDLADRGRIAVGLRADLLLVDGDPTSDIKTLSNVVGVWKAGHAIDSSKRKEVVQKEIERAKNKPAAAKEDRVVSHFDEDKGDAPVAEFGAGWTVSTDSMMGGDSTCEMGWKEDGAADSKGSLVIAGTCRKQQPAFAGAMFVPGENQMSATDVSAHQGISFWGKGNGESFKIMLFFQKRGFMPSTKSFVAGKEWKQYSFKISDFDGCDGTDVNGFWFGHNSSGKFEFQIDEVKLTK